MAKDVRPIGVEHLSESFLQPRAGCGLFPLNWGMYTIKQSAHQLMSLFKKDNQVRFGMTAAGTTGSAEGMVQIPMANLFANRTDIAKAVFGFRWKPGNRQASTSLPFGAFLNRVTSDGSSAPDNTMVAIGSAQAECYIEIEIIPYNGSPGYGYFVYKDGEQISSGAMGTWFTRPQMPTIQFTIGTGAGAMANQVSGWAQGDYVFSMEDIYVAWSTDQTDNLRLGPIRVKRLPVSQVTLNGWTPQGGKSAIDILNLANNGLDARTDYLASDPGNTVVKCKLDLSVLKTTERVLALGASTSAWRDGASVGTLSTRWEHTDGQGSAVSYSPTSGVYTNQYDIPLQTLTTTPGGAALNKASMAALELVVTPGA